MNEFNRGVFYVAAMLVEIGESTSLAADIIKQAGLSAEDCSTLDEHDKQHLRAVNEESDMALTGL